jgi:hypothetical protein
MLPPIAACSTKIYWTYLLPLPLSMLLDPSAESEKTMSVNHHSE